MPEIKPQPGFQEKVLACTADIAIIGGSAGPGKTWCQLVEPLYHAHVPDFTCVMFRNTFPEIMAPGGLWDAAGKIYGMLGNSASTLQPRPTWKVGKARIQFAYMDSDEDAKAWDGSELNAIVFNELTHFSKFQFLRLLARNRSTSGVRPYVRADCNPDPDSWVKELVQWWIDPDTGYAIPERDGVHRYLMVYKDNYVWGDTKEQVRDQVPEIFQQPEYVSGEKDYRNSIKSITYIAGKRSENKKMAEINPEYEGNLLMLGEADYKRFGEGNWNSGGDGLRMFEDAAIKDIWSNPVEHVPRRLVGYDNSGLPMYRSGGSKKKYITCDAARFGRDLCVIYVWDGWEVIHVSIFKQSDQHDIVKEIETLRAHHGIPKSSVMLDADGVGGDTVKLGDYLAFHGGQAAMPDPKNKKNRENENYRNLKTQCYYRYAARVNNRQVTYTVTSGSCKVFETPGKGVYGLGISLGGKVQDVRDLIKADFRAMKRAKTEKDGSVFKYEMNTKEEHKVILKRSPDFGDVGSMREAFELIRVYESNIGVAG